MTCDENEVCLGSPLAHGEAELVADGWQRCFIADEPRLSEAVETYEELGFEVITVPVDLDGGGCTECMKQAPGSSRVIFTRKRPAPCGQGEA